MKKIISLGRFVLLMIGGLFLTIAIFIVNGCKSLNVRPKIGNGTDANKGQASAPANAEAEKLQKLPAEELIVRLNSEKVSDRQSAEDALISKGQDAVPKLKESVNDKDPEVRMRVRRILTRLGWYVTRAGQVEKMSESKEFQEMMKKRLPEMPAE
jgi:hypothetical protein